MATIKIDKGQNSLVWDSQAKDSIDNLSRGLLTLDLTYHFNGI